MRAFCLTIISINSIACLGQKNNQGTSLSIPLVTTYTSSRYNAGIQNWAIAQDSTGYLYVANNYGLLEFDGATWSRYDIPKSTKTRSVIVQTKTNDIYVGGQHQLGYFQKTVSGLKYIDLLDQIPNEISIGEVWDLIEYEGQILANVTGNIVSITDNKITILHDFNENVFISKVQNELVVGSSVGIYQYVDQTATFDLLTKSQGKNFRGIIEEVNGNLLLFTYDGEIFRFNNNHLNRLQTPMDDFLNDSKINKVLKLTNGNIVIGTQNNGLLILNHQLLFVQHLTKNKGLDHRTVLSLHEDNFGNLWIGLNNGICFIELNSPFSLINEDVGLKGTGYSATTRQNQIYLGTSSGVFEQKNDGNIIESEESYYVIKESEGLVNNITTIDNHLFISHHEGSFLIDNSGIKHFFKELGTWKFDKTASGQYLGGTYNGFFLFERKGKAIVLKKQLGGFKESSRIFEFANDSTLWMTHGYKGAYKIILRKDTINSVQHYGKKDGFPSDILISVYKIDDNLIFTAERGIYKYDEETDVFEPHDFFNKWFSDEHVSKIEQTDSGQIYFIANGEIGLLQKKSIGIYQIEKRRFRKINNYLSDDLENIHLLDNNKVFFGAKEGFILYQPELYNETSQPLRTFLKKVTIADAQDSTRQVLGEFFSSLSIKRPKFMRFEFSSPFFDGLENLRYSYRLTPYEETWSDWTSTNWKEYTNLAPDDYTFEVKSKNIYEDESIPTVYRFSISPKRYKSNTAYIIYLTSFIFFFVSILYIRERKHKTEKQIIYQTKDEALRSKELEISAFSEKTIQQIQALKSENLKKEIDHKNSQLASVTMHLLSKNEFVASIRKRISEVIQTNDNNSLQHIVKSIDRNNDKDEAWETFAHHFDQVHGNFLHKLKKEIRLTPQETKLCAYLKMNMSTKDIANLMNITVRGVELARYRLRKKLGLSRDTNLIAYLNEF